MSAEITEFERSIAVRSAGMKASERRKFFVDHGMCPECGKEAAPYYLCQYHRTLGAMSRLLNKMAARGIVSKEKQGRSNAWRIDKDNTAKVDDYRWGETIFDMSPDDPRLRPRMGRRPIDLDETMFLIFRDAGKPLRMEEIYAAWGKLRSKRKTASLAGDMAAIIAARRRREAREAKLRRLPLSPTERRVSSPASEKQHDD